MKTVGKTFDKKQPRKPVKADGKAEGQKQEQAAKADGKAEGNGPA